MATIIIQPEQSIDIDTNSLVLDRVVDSSASQTIWTTIPALGRDIYLWYGPVEYEEAGIWTNESALQRAKDLINSGNIRFV
ncbi:hypothetical protein EBZ39_08655 [bacterium]|nr:hypothetical protein [bacterium]